MISRPLPEPNECTAYYWSAAQNHRLVLQRCPNCEVIQFYPRALCTNCLSDRLDWIEASGKGQVYSHTTVHRVLTPGFEESVPYVVAVIELDEGVRLISQVVNCEPGHVSVGMSVEVVFETVSDDVTIPKFQPSTDHA